MRKGKLKCDLLFVAFSRTDYNSLYILGKFDRPTGKANESGINEIDRLRNEAKIKFSFDTLKQKINGFTIMYQNINSFNTKFKHILADEWFSRNDVLIFAEANMSILKKSHVLKDFEAIYPLKDHNYVSSPHRGIVIMAKKTRNIQLYKSDIFDDVQSKIHVDLKSFQIEDHFIICGYKSPLTPSKIFREKLQAFLNAIPQSTHLTILGDFNLDSAKTKRFQSEILNKISLKNNFEKEIIFHNQLSDNDETTTRQTQIDVVFSTSLDGYAGIYPTYFSDHNVIFYRSKKPLAETIEEKNHAKSNNIEENNLNLKKNNDKKPIIKKDIDSLSKKESFNEIFNEQNMEEICKTICNISQEKNSDDSKIINFSPQANKNLSYDVKTLLDDIVINEAYFQNSIRNIIMCYDKGLANYKIKNLSSYNSCFHGLLKIYHENNQFRNFCKEQTDFSIFQFLSEILTVKNLEKRDYYWVKFILLQFKRKSEIKHPTKIDSDGRKKYFINMQNESKLTIDIYQSLNEESLLGNSFSVIKETVCSNCKLLIKREYCRQVNLLNVRKDDFDNLHYKILNSQNNNNSCPESACNGKSIINLKFGFLAILIIQKDTSDGKSCFDDLFYQNISEEIVLRNEKNENRIYCLQFIQHFELFGKDVKHYTSILNYHSSFIEIDDLSPENAIYLSKLSPINPHSLIYLDKTDSEVFKSKIFENQFEITLQLTPDKKIEKNLYNMCCYNSFIHGMLRFYRFNKSFKEYIDINEYKIRFFSIIPQILKSNNTSTRNKIWCEYIYSLDRRKFNSGNMSDGDSNMLFKFFVNFFSYHMKCLNCGYIPVKTTGEKFGNSHVYIDVPENRKMEENIISILIYNFFETFGKRRNCINCKNSYSYSLDKLLIIHIFSPQYMMDSNNCPELIFSQLPQTLTLNGKLYKLIFVQESKMPYLWHFVVKYNLSNGSHLEIDDMKSEARILNNDKLVNPKILFFFCTDY